MPGIGSLDDGSSAGGEIETEAGREVVTDLAVTKTCFRLRPDDPEPEVAGVTTTVVEDLALLRLGLEACSTRTTLVDEAWGTGLLRIAAVALGLVSLDVVDAALGNDELVDVDTMGVIVTPPGVLVASRF